MDDEHGVENPKPDLVFVLVQQHLYGSNGQKKQQIDDLNELFHGQIGIGGSVKIRHFTAKFRQGLIIVQTKQHSEAEPVGSDEAETRGNERSPGQPSHVKLGEPPERHKKPQFGKGQRGQRKKQVGQETRHGSWILVERGEAEKREQGEKEDDVAGLERVQLNHNGHEQGKQAADDAGTDSYQGVVVV